MVSFVIIIPNMVEHKNYFKPAKKLCVEENTSSAESAARDSPVQCLMTKGFMSHRTQIASTEGLASPTGIISNIVVANQNVLRLSPLMAPNWQINPHPNE
jgi:hypothetical protein